MAFNKKLLTIVFGAIFLLSSVTIAIHSSRESSPTADVTFKSEAVKSTSSSVLNLVIIWHQHQPSYQDPSTKVYEQPWVFMHGINSYPYMADVLKDFPDINVTINLTPSLIKQLDDYVTGRAYDRRLELYKMDESAMSYENKSIVMQYFFDINSQFKQPGTWYAHLQEKANSYTTLKEKVDAFTDQDFRDLKVLFLASWINPRYTSLSQSPVVNITLEHNKEGIGGYSKTDKLNIYNYAESIIKHVFKFHDQAENAGQLEIMTTPFYHPILPLLIDLNSARLADAGNAQLPLPEQNTLWTEDALAQIQKGRNLTIAHFGDEPLVARGMWPSEEAVSPQIIPLVNQSDINWFVTDATVLQKGLGVSKLTPEQWYQPYQVSQDGNTSAVFYRDQDLSNEISFNLAGLDPNDAAQSLVDKLHTIQQDWTGSKDPVVTIALDGENAWENYQYDVNGDGYIDYTGNLFREDFYRKLEQAQDAGWLQTTTPSQYLKDHPVSSLSSVPLKVGSWAGDLTTWIGEPDENQAWDWLITTRKDLVAYGNAHPTENLSDAWEALYAAEGSDWFWWYGTDQNSGHDELFDWGFKTILRSVYHDIHWTDQQILDAYPILFLQQKAGINAKIETKTLPTIDGVLTSPKEWLPSAAYYNDSLTKETDGVINGLYLVVDEGLQDLHFRVDLNTSKQLSDYSLEFYFSKPNPKNIALFPLYSDKTNTANIIGFPLSNALAVNLSDPTVMSVYRVDSNSDWVLNSTTVTTIKFVDFLEFSVPLSVIEYVKGDLSLISVIATKNNVLENVDIAPEDGPWSFMIPFGGVDMTEVFTMNDPAYDEHGVYPTNPEMHPDYNTSKTGLMDILRFRVGYSNGMVHFEFKFRELFNPWNGPAGYSHPLMQVYIDKVAGSGSTECDQNGHFTISADHAWDVMVRSDGWLRYVLWPNGTQSSGVTSSSDSVDKIIYF